MKLLDHRYFSGQTATNRIKSHPKFTPSDNSIGKVSGLDVFYWDLLQQLIQGQKEKQDRKTNNDPQITTQETEY
jgi:hypothetical protein